MTTHYVAVLDTSGASYDGPTFVGLGATAAQATAAVLAAPLADGPWTDLRFTDRTMTTDQDVADWYGEPRVYGPLSDGGAVRDDD